MLMVPASGVLGFACQNCPPVPGPTSGWAPVVGIAVLTAVMFALLFVMIYVWREPKRSPSEQNRGKVDTPAPTIDDPNANYTGLRQRRDQRTLGASAPPTRDKRQTNHSSD